MPRYPTHHPDMLTARQTASYVRRLLNRTSASNVLTTLDRIEGLDIEFSASQVALMCGVLRETLYEIKDIFKSAVQAALEKERERQAGEDNESDSASVTLSLDEKLEDIDVNDDATFTQSGLASSFLAPRPRISLAVAKGDVNKPATIISSPDHPYSYNEELLLGSKQVERRYLVLHYDPGVSTTLIQERITRDLGKISSYHIATDKNTGQIIVYVQFRARVKTSGPVTFTVTGKHPKVYSVTPAQREGVVKYITTKCALIQASG